MSYKKRICDVLCNSDASINEDRGHGVRENENVPENRNFTCLYLIPTTTPGACFNGQIPSYFTGMASFMLKERQLVVR